MSNLVAVIACPTGIAHTIMAEEALRQAADRTGHQLRVETQSAAGTRNTLDAHDIAAADAVIVAADVNVNTDRFAGKPILSVGTIPVIRDAEGLIRQALGQAGASAPPDAATAPARDQGMPQIVAVTSCPTGICIGAPVSVTSVSRARPETSCIAMQRTRLRPRCWATSSTRRPSFTLTSRAFLIAGK